MTPFYAIRIVDGRQQVGLTTDGRDFDPVATFETPRQAIDVANAMDRGIPYTSPLRTRWSALDGRAPLGSEHGEPERSGASDNAPMPGTANRRPPSAATRSKVLTDLVQRPAR